MRLASTWRRLRLTLRLGSALLLLAVFALELPVSPVAATQSGATLTVTTTADTIAADGFCSLREAIRAANTNRTVNECTHNRKSGVDAIAFNIAGSGPHTIAVTAALPTVSGPLIIDGTTQPGFAGTPVIELNGAGAGATSGLTISAGNSTVRGLAINRFQRDGILITTKGGNTIAGNFIGVDTTGIAARPNGGDGVQVERTSGNTIGGTSAGARNLVSGNGGHGIFLVGAFDNRVLGNYVGVDATGATAVPNGIDGVAIDGGAHNTVGGTIPAARNVISGNTNQGVAIFTIFADNGSGNRIQGNYIGVDATGAAALPNGGDGVRLKACDNIVGGTSAGAGNLIAGNGGHGVRIADATTTGNVVQGNRIGVAADGSALPNALDGVSIEGGAGANLIGGSAPGAGNTIASNGRAGIAVAAGVGNTLRGNAIARNGGLGVDLGGDGITPNDPGDSDSGPNQLQNFPTLSAAIAVESATTISGTLASAAHTTYTLDFYASAVCDPTGFGPGQIYLGSSSVTTGADGGIDFSVTLPTPSATDFFLTATATDPAGNTSEFSACRIVAPPPIDLFNRAWPIAYPLALTEVEQAVFAATVDQHLLFDDQSAWFRFDVQPGATVMVELTNLPADYDLVLYKDIAAAYQELITPADLLQQSAEMSPDYIRPDYIRPDYIRPDYIRPDYIRPDYIRPDYIRPDYIRPDYIRPDYIRFDDALAVESYSNAQNRSLLAFSARDGAADELIVQNTWDNTGNYYVRVRGRDGAFSSAAPFRLTVTLMTGICGAVQPITTPSTIAATAGDYRTIILTDLARMEGSEAERRALWERLATFAARPEVAGAVVNVGEYAPLGLPGDARVMAAHAQGDANLACPYAQNIVAESIKAIVDSYRAVNPTLEYVVIVGNDGVIPFFRHPEQVGLGQEKTYEPPVGEFTRSNASLKLSYVLGQDRYGTQTELTSLNRSLPIPDLAVGRLVETAAEATGMLDAYLATSGGVVATPSSALVSGYDFNTPDALIVAEELTAGLGQPVDTLISARNLAPNAPPCPDPFVSGEECAWTADNLRSLLLANRYDLVYFGGHFSQARALAADYTTRMLAVEVAESAVDFTNTIVFSMGCHSGYNTVNADTLPWTDTPDWAQAFARKRATLIAGTGYQYGDTEVSEYSARLLNEFSRQLRLGAGPVAVGQALVAAKQVYLADTPQLNGTHDKTLVQVTLYGLPMLRIDVPAGRIPAPADDPLVSAPTPLGDGLFAATVRVNPTLTPQTRTLTPVGGGDPLTATYLSGANGVSVEPDQPVLPLEIRNIQVEDLVARGVGFRGGSYVDTAEIVPLTGAPATELPGTRAFFTSSSFYPDRLWNINYTGALADPVNGATRLILTPAQFVSSALGAERGTLRSYTAMDMRLFYSNNLGPTALAGFPSILGVAALPAGDRLRFSITAQGDPLADLREVWVVYTGAPGSPFYGTWQPLDLTRSAGDPALWEGELAIGATSAQEIFFLVQAANASGLVTLDSNNGALYRGGAAPGQFAPRAGTVLTLQAPASVEYAGSAAFTATLRSDGGALLAGQPIAFAIGTQTIFATTDQNGVAMATLQLFQPPGAYTVTAAFAATADYGAAAASADLTVARLATTLTLLPPAPQEYRESTPTVALLADSAGRALAEKTVFFVVNGPGGPYRQSAITDYRGYAPLNLALGNGAYAIEAYFSGVIPLGDGQFLTRTDPVYLPATATGALTIADATAPETTITIFPPNPSAASVSFSFTGSDAESGVAGFECSLDGADFAPCRSPQLYSGLNAGERTFAVRAVDAAGNRDQTPASYTWTVDGKPPVTTLTLSGVQKSCGPDPNPPYGATCFVNTATVILTASADAARTLYRVQPPGGAFGPWQTYAGPFTLSTEGDNNVEYYSVGQTGAVEPIQTKLIKITYLTSGLLDGFNRANGPLGPNWAGGTSGYSILRRQVHVGSGGAIYWAKGKPFGVDQEAFVTLTSLVAGGEHSLLLKVQGSSPDWRKGAIRVRYDAGTGTLWLETRQEHATEWTSYAPIAAPFANGDQLGARVRPDGQVWLYKNCVRIATLTLTSADQRFFNDRGGRIGLWFANANTAIFDDFGGGTALPLP